MLRNVNSQRCYFFGRDSGGVQYENAFNLDSEWGPARLDRRHQFNGYAVFFLPYNVDLSTGFRFMSGLPISLSLPCWLFVHAGIRPGLPLALQSHDDLTWIRAPFLTSQLTGGLRVVHTGDDSRSGGTAEEESEPQRGRNRERHERPHLPVRDISEDRRGDPIRGP